jgi:hypothetical protein
MKSLYTITESRRGIIIFTNFIKITVFFIILKILFLNNIDFKRQNQLDLEKLHHHIELERKLDSLTDNPILNTYIEFQPPIRPVGRMITAESGASSARPKPLAKLSLFPYLINCITTSIQTSKSSL